jgi:Sortase domain
VSSTGRPGYHRAAAGSGWVWRRRWAVAAVLLLVAAGIFGAQLRERPVPRPASLLVPPVAAPGGPPTEPPRAERTPVGSAPAATAARVPPVALRIPALGLAVRLTELGLNRDRTVQVPTDFQRPGWFRLGPTPGQPGSAVILGHVDSYRGPAVFFRLRSLRPGDQVAVDLADGEVTRFAVRAVETYPKRDFPAQRVYGSHGGRALQLVTCGGQFDRRARSYLSNVVVYTELVSVTPASAGAG